MTDEFWFKCGHLRHNWAKMRKYEGFVRRLIDEYWETPHMGNMDETNAPGVMSA